MTRRKRPRRTAVLNVLAATVCGANLGVLLNGSYIAPEETIWAWNSASVADKRSEVERILRGWRATPVPDPYRFWPAVYADLANKHPGWTCVEYRKGFSSVWVFYDADGAAFDAWPRDGID